jgi:hypothetical protein
MFMLTLDSKASKSASKWGLGSMACCDAASKRRKLNLKDPADGIYDKILRLKAGVRAKDRISIPNF